MGAFSALPPSTRLRLPRYALLPPGSALPLATLLLACTALLPACGGGGSHSATGWPNASGEVEVDYNAGLAAMQGLNRWRISSGITPVALSYSQSVGCQLHANYLFNNRIDLAVAGLTAHNEIAHLPGYTAEGEAAGQASVIYQGVEPAEAIEGWMQTFYHRLGLMDPNLSSIGFGSSGEYQVMDIIRGRRFGYDAVPATSRFPAAGMMDAPSSYRTEIPHPIPGDNELGVPITVEFFGSRGYSILGLRAELTDSLSGAAIPFYLQGPGSAFLPEWDLQQVICLIPKEPLESGRGYDVSLEAWVDGEQWASEWTFRTR